MSSPSDPVQAMSEPHGNSLRVSIIMPCLNEAETLGAAINEALAALQASGTAGEVIVVDNGSTDGSIEIVLASGARLIQAKERGYGMALRKGLDAALAPYAIYADCDGSYDFGETGNLARQAGSRRGSGAGQPFSRGRWNA